MKMRVALENWAENSMAALARIYNDHYFGVDFNTFIEKALETMRNEVESYQEKEEEQK